MKKPKPAPALAIEDVLGYVDACRITGNEDTIAAQIAAWAVSLHARNLELAAEVLPIETKRDAENAQLRGISIDPLSGNAIEVKPRPIVPFRS